MIDYEKRIRNRIEYWKQNPYESTKFSQCILEELLRLLTKDELPEEKEHNRPYFRFL